MNGPLRVYDDDLHGSAILLVALRSDFEQTVKDALWGKGQPRIELQCPSSIMAVIERYVSALHVVEEFGGIQVVEVTEFVLKKLMIDPTSGQLGSRINPTVGFPPFLSPVSGGSKSVGCSRVFRPLLALESPVCAHVPVCESRGEAAAMQSDLATDAVRFDLCSQIKEEIGGCETNAIAKWFARHLVKPGVYYSPMQRAFFSKQTNVRSGLPFEPHFVPQSPLICHSPPLPPHSSATPHHLSSHSHRSSSASRRSRSCGTYARWSALLA